MSDLEDLDTPETRSHATYLDESDWEQEGDDEGCIIFNEDGTFGCVHTLTVERRQVVLTPELNPTLTADLEPLLIDLAECVGQINAVYTSTSSNQPKRYRGSGFWISPTRILTARHVLKSPRIIDNVEWVLSDLYIDNRPTITKFDIGCAVKLKIPNPEDIIVTSAPGFYLETTPQGEKRCWKTNNDFIIVNTFDESYTHGNYATPVPPPFAYSASCAVIGYPSSISQEKFAQDYQPFPETVTSSQCYHAVASVMRGFNDRIVAQNNFWPDRHDQTGVLQHDCPTLRGTSGGLLVDLHTLLEQKKNVFTGIHLGGNIRMHNNYALAVSYPALASAVGVSFQSQAADPLSTSDIIG